MLPKLILLGLFTMSLTIHIVKHGEEKKTKNYHAGYAFLGLLLELGLLYWAGFFDSFQ